MRYLALLLFLLFVIPSSAAGGVVYPEMMFVLDGSGSMWGKIGTETKIEAAKRVMHQAVPALPSEVKIGLTTYGHNRKGDCDDIEVLVPVGAVDRNGLLARVEAISPRGKTPIAASLRRITEQLKNKEEETTIVLVSDGEETCDSDPCGAVKALKEAGLKFILHVVGFGVNSMQSDQLACLAREGGGSYFGADDGGALLAALATVGREVGQKVEKARTAVKKNSTKLGKLQVTIPEDGLECLNSLKIVRKKDGKLLRTVEDPRPNATFPLLDGEYELVAGYANSNYKPDSEVTLGTWIVRGGETTVVPMGLLRVNIADPLKEMPTGAVIVNSVAQGFELVTPYNDNPYFLYKPKPVPPGEYTFSVHYKLNYLYRDHRFRYQAEKGGRAHAQWLGTQGQRR
jgi:hypothetical protein